MARGKGNGGDWLSEAVKKQMVQVSTDDHMWVSVDAECIGEFVQAVTGAGHAVLMGTTSDGGAMSVCVFVGDTKMRFYEADSPTMTQRLQTLINAAPKG